MVGTGTVGKMGLDVGVEVGGEGGVSEGFSVGEAVGFVGLSVGMIGAIVGFLVGASPISGNWYLFKRAPEYSSLQLETVLYASLSTPEQSSAISFLFVQIAQEGQSLP